MLKTLTIQNKTYKYNSLTEINASCPVNITHIPYVTRIFIENILRYKNKGLVTDKEYRSVLQALPNGKSKLPFPFMPGRVLLQDYTGVPVLVDLATMRDVCRKFGMPADKINPFIRTDLVVDHSVQVDFYGEVDSYTKNINREMERNKERYSLLKWAQKSFDNLTIFPPGSGIVHQLNLEKLADLITVDGDLVYPDSCIGADSHTTMVSGLSVLAWGVGGIEAEAVMLNQPYYMTLPEVVGVRLVGELNSTVTATDLVLYITQTLRRLGVVEKVVEFYGPGLKNLPVADRATISNMSPEYGATTAFFPIDQKTLNYLAQTNRKTDHIELVKAYAKNNYLWHDDYSQPIYSQQIEFDLSTVAVSMSGPNQPHDRKALHAVSADFKKIFANSPKPHSVNFKDTTFELEQGSVVIAAITSCTNTSNPKVMFGSALMAKKAVEFGLTAKPWVKTSLAPGSRAVIDYLKNSKLLTYLEQLGFNLVGFGCTTCIGNSGPLAPEIAKAVKESEIVVTGVLSGNRNFEGRINPLVKANYLASPLLVVAYSLVGKITHNFTKEPIGHTKDNKPIFLKDIWPSQEELSSLIDKYVTTDIYQSASNGSINGDWDAIFAEESKTFLWDLNSSYIKQVPYFDYFELKPEPTRNLVRARVLAKFGDFLSTDHISPAGSISPISPAATYLKNRSVEQKDFNSYGARRGNHEVMMRGTFANTFLNNHLVSDKVGNYTLLLPDAKVVSVFEAAECYKERLIPLIILAGKNYGSGSSRDWAAKGPLLLGVRAVIAESYEKIHRSNLIGMGILPLQFKPGESAKSLDLDGTETYDIVGISKELEPNSVAHVYAKKADSKIIPFSVNVAIVNHVELEYYKNGGLLPFVMRKVIG